MNNSWEVKINHLNILEVLSFLLTERNLVAIGTAANLNVIVMNWHISKLAILLLEEL